MFMDMVRVMVVIMVTVVGFKQVQAGEQEQAQTSSRGPITLIEI